MPSWLPTVWYFEYPDSMSLWVTCLYVTVSTLTLSPWVPWLHVNVISLTLCHHENPDSSSPWVPWLCHHKFPDSMSLWVPWLHVIVNSLTLCHHEYLHLMALFSAIYFVHCCRYIQMSLKVSQSSMGSEIGCIHLSYTGARIWEMMSQMKTELLESSRSAFSCFHLLLVRWK